MTIRKGEQWGDIGPLPSDAVQVHDDVALGVLVESARLAGTAVPPIALLGGDLMRAVGGTGDVSRFDGDVARLPVDVVHVVADGRQRWFVAHLVARRTWWRGELIAAMNAQHLGRWDLVPRSHPNDGRVDVVRVAPTMSIGDRRRANSRAVHAAHVPHPDIEIRSVPATTLQFARPLKLWVDGRPWITATSVELTVEPDALLVCV